MSLSATVPLPLRFRRKSSSSVSDDIRSSPFPALHHSCSSSSPVPSSPAPKTPSSTHFSYGFSYAGIQSSPRLAFEINPQRTNQISDPVLSEQTQDWNHTFRHSRNKVSTEAPKYVLPSFRASFPSDDDLPFASDVDSSEFSEDAILYAGPAHSSAFYSDSEEDMDPDDDDDGFAFDDEQDVRATFFSTSAERGRWRSDPIVRKSEPSMPSKSLGSIDLGVITRPFSEPAPSLNTVGSPLLSLDLSTSRENIDISKDEYPLTEYMHNPSELLTVEPTLNHSMVARPFSNDSAEPEETISDICQQDISSDVASGNDDTQSPVQAIPIVPRQQISEDPDIVGRPLSLSPVAVMPENTIQSQPEVTPVKDIPITSVQPTLGTTMIPLHLDLVAQPHVSPITENPIQSQSEVTPADNTTAGSNITLPSSPVTSPIFRAHSPLPPSSPPLSPMSNASCSSPLPGPSPLPTPTSPILQPLSPLTAALSPFTLQPALSMIDLDSEMELELDLQHMGMRTVSSVPFSPVSPISYLGDIETESPVSPCSVNHELASNGAGPEEDLSSNFLQPERAEEDKSLLLGQYPAFSPITFRSLSAEPSELTVPQPVGESSRAPDLEVNLPALTESEVNTIAKPVLEGGEGTVSIGGTCPVQSASSTVDMDVKIERTEPKDWKSKVGGSSARSDGSKRHKPCLDDEGPVKKKRRRDNDLSPVSQLSRTQSKDKKSPESEAPRSSASSRKRGGDADCDDIASSSTRVEKPKRTADLGREGENRDEGSSTSRRPRTRTTATTVAESLSKQPLQQASSSRSSSPTLRRARESKGSTRNSKPTNDSSSSSVPVRKKLKRDSGAQKDQEEGRVDGGSVSEQPPSRLKSKSKPKRTKPTSTSTSDLPHLSPDPDSGLSSAMHAELCGMLIESMALSRASSLPLSTLYKSVMQTRPALRAERSEGEWLSVFERILRRGEARPGGGVFGKVESSGKDDANRPLEAQWFYVPERDEDQERAALLRSMMPRPGKRSTTMKYKQYYYMPLDKISRWEPEDEI